MHAATNQQARATKPFSLNPTGTLLRRHLAQFVSAVDIRDLSKKGVDRDWPDIPYPERLGLVSAMLSDGVTDPTEAVASKIGYARITTRFRDGIEGLAAACRTRA